MVSSHLRDVRAEKAPRLKKKSQKTRFFDDFLTIFRHFVEEGCISSCFEVTIFDISPQNWEKNFLGGFFTLEGQRK